MTHFDKAYPGEQRSVFVSRGESVNVFSEEVSVKLTPPLLLAIPGAIAAVLSVITTSG
jgi:hypothetical protein